MSIAKKYFRDSLLILSIATTLFLVIDFVLGERILSSIRQPEPFRIQHATYHHTLRSNFDGIGRWGNWTYRMCTNAHGFKDRCRDNTNSNKSFDLAFVGDSFTEGIGLPFEQTFVGIVADKYPQLRVANLGVVSYSPAIHLAKLNSLYANGYRFKHVIVFIDIGDVYDEANAYDLHNETVVVDKGEPYPLTGLRWVRRFAAKHLPLTGEVWVQVRRLANRETTNSTTPLAPVSSSDSKNPALNGTPITASAPPTSEQLTREPKTPARQDDAPFLKNIYEGIYLKNYPKSEWTYNVQSPHFGQDGVTGTLKKMTSQMAAIHRLVTSHGGTLSIGVYPWPGQILYDDVDSLQVKTWREFCTNRCLRFYDAFPSFFKLAEATNKDAVVHKYYFAGDAHFNAEGNKVIAETILAQGVQ